MQKAIRVYTDPNTSIDFIRYSNVAEATLAVITTAGVFAPKKARKVQMFIGQGWSMHISGDWGRVVVTGDLETLSEAEELRKEMLP